VGALLWLSARPSVSLRAVVNVVGQRVRRREDRRLLRGTGRFVDDLPLPGARHVTFVRSDLAHARVLGIDHSEASRIPGVRVFTADDLRLAPFPLLPFLKIDPRMARPPLARDTVRFAGEIVAAVAAPTAALAADAAELVHVDYEALPAVTDVEAAMRDEVVLFDEVGTNVCAHRVTPERDPRLLDDCPVVVSGRLISQRLAACPLEPRATAARVGGDGRLEMWLSTQTPHRDRAGLSNALGIPLEQIRVLAPDVGGGFGGKGLDVEDVLVAAVARVTGEPVRWTETRSENLIAMHHGRAQRIDFTAGADPTGRVRALRLRIVQDLGAYPGLGAFLPTFTGLMACGVYAIDAVEVETVTVVTNTTQIAAVRGAGRPEATQVIERVMDRIAGELSLDPAEVRRRNLIGRDAFPHTTATGARYDSGDYEAALDLALLTADYVELRAEQIRRRRHPDLPQIGIGVSTYVEVTNGIGESEYAGVEITSDATAVITTGSFSHGQGHETTFAQIAAERLGLDLDCVVVRAGDTDVVPRGSGTFGSKSTQIGGAAVRQASEEVVDRARRLVADELEADPADVVLDPATGRFHVAGVPQVARTWAQLSARLHATGRLAELSVQTDFVPEQPTFPFGSHVAVVEVDVDTGAVKLMRLIAVDDAGTIINPLIAEGQVHGGIAAGVAQALFEEIGYDEDGNPLNANLVTYGFPGAPDLPSFQAVSMATPTPVNPLGAKGIGESGTIGATPAVQSAVIDAVSHLGVRHIDMPLSGERVWRAIRQARVHSV
jgi:carbon-monoxide dehydrogenase large subunit